MNISVTTPLEGAAFALFTYFLTFIITLVVVGLIKLMYYLIRRKGQQPGPPKKERKIEEILT
jgi:hypothetical protein